MTSSLSFDLFICTTGVIRLRASPPRILVGVDEALSNETPCRQVARAASPILPSRLVVVSPHTAAALGKQCALLGEAYY